MARCIFKHGCRQLTNKKDGRGGEEQGTTVGAVWVGGGGGGKGSGAGKTDHHLRHRRRAVITPNHRTLPVPISSSPEARTFSLSAKWWRARPQARVGGWVRGCVGGGGRRGCQSQERRTGHGMLHTPSTAFRHLPPNSARFGYASEGALFISVARQFAVTSVMMLFSLVDVVHL